MGWLAYHFHWDPHVVEGLTLRQLRRWIERLEEIGEELKDAQHGGGH
ncbi:hypothetical protein [Magnetococcus sp. PR-3]